MLEWQRGDGIVQRRPQLQAQAEPSPLASHKLNPAAGSDRGDVHMGWVGLGYWSRRAGLFTLVGRPDVHWEVHGTGRVVGQAGRARAKSAFREAIIARSGLPFLVDPNQHQSKTLRRGQSVAYIHRWRRDTAGKQLSSLN